MIKRIYRQRRRLIFLTVMVALTALVASIGNDALRYFLKHSLDGSVWLFAASAGLALMVVMLCVSLLVLFFVPSLRRVLEVTAVSAFLVECITHADGALPVWALQGWAPAVWYLGFFYALLTVLERDVFYRSGLRLRFHAQRSRVINAAPDAIWAALAPSAETQGTYWTKAIANVAARPDISPNTFEVRFRMGPGIGLVQTHTRRIWQRPLYLLYDFKPTDQLDSARGIAGSFEMRCEPLPDGRTRLTTTHDYPAIGIGTWLLIWLDDLVGCEMDAIQARLTGRRDWSLAGWSARKMAGA